MAEVTNELIYEVLRSVQEQVARQDEKLDGMQGELVAIRGYLYGLTKDVANIYTMLAQHDVRLDRIERRLELREPEPA